MRERISALDFSLFTFHSSFVYDSSGIALLGDGPNGQEICIERATGKLINLERRLERIPN